MNTTETYDLVEDKWTTIDAKLQVRRTDHSAVVHSEKIFVVGGIRRNKPTSSVEVYSSVTKQFTMVTRMSQSRACFGCSILNGKIFVFGGFSRLDEMTDSAEVYDVEKKSWSGGPRLPLPLGECGCASNYQL